MAETDLSSRDPVIASPFRTAFIQSAESFSTVPSEYILDEETKQAMLAQHTSKNVDVSYLTGVAQADEPESEENNFDDRVRPYLVSYQYFVSYPNLVNVPESHELAGSRYVVNPTRSYAFCKEDSRISAAEMHDLETYWKDVIDTESSKSVLDHEAWKSIVNTELQSIPGESIAKLLTRGAAWSLSNDRIRMKSWVNNQIDDKFPEHRPNFDHKQYTRGNEFVRCNWPNWPPEGLKPMDLSDIERENEEQWGDKVLGDDLPFLFYNAAGDSVLVIPEIKSSQ